MLVCLCHLAKRDIFASVVPAQLSMRPMFAEIPFGDFGAIWQSVVTGQNSLTSPRFGTCFYHRKGKRKMSEEMHSNHMDQSQLLRPALCASQARVESSA